MTVTVDPISLDLAFQRLEHATGFDVRALIEERDRLREAVHNFAAHDSWRCAHPPHYYFAGDPPEDGDCACGLLSTLTAVGVDPEPWQRGDGVA